jgi:hypothetical protein
MHLDQLIKRGECKGPINFQWHFKNFLSANGIVNELTHCLLKGGIHFLHKWLMVWGILDLFEEMHACRMLNTKPRAIQPLNP